MESLNSIEGRVVLWLGAGISMDPPTLAPSGPALTRRWLDWTSDEFYTREILEFIDHHGELLGGKTCLRLEQLIELSVQHYGSEILKGLAFLGDVELNDIHRMVARYALTHRTWVITTNFDECIERADEALDVFSYPCQDPDRAQVLLDDLRNERRADWGVLKIHGTVGDGLSDLATTVVALQRGFNRHMVDLLKWILGREGTTVVFAGYSGSDYFDIVPFLRLLETAPLPCQIVYVQHDEDEEAPRQGTPDDDNILTELMRGLKEGAVTWRGRTREVLPVLLGEEPLAPVARENWEPPFRVLPFEQKWRFSQKLADHTGYLLHQGKIYLTPRDIENLRRTNPPSCLAHKRSISEDLFFPWENDDQHQSASYRRQFSTSLALFLSRSATTNLPFLSSILGVDVLYRFRGILGWLVRRCTEGVRHAGEDERTAAERAVTDIIDLRISMALDGGRAIRGLAEDQAYQLMMRVHEGSSTRMIDLVRMPSLFFSSLEYARETDQYLTLAATHYEIGRLFTFQLERRHFARSWWAKRGEAWQELVAETLASFTIKHVLQSIDLYRALGRQTRAARAMKLYQKLIRIIDAR